MADALWEWVELVSEANWQKGRVITEWREAEELRHDQMFAAAVGGISPNHVTRLRRVHNEWADQREEYPNLLWSHFQAVLDWNDAGRWLAEANKHGWSTAEMREHKWAAVGDTMSYE